jgi:hypothetical protein
VASALLLTGCAQTPFSDDSFTESIPAAVEDSGLGITDVWADKALDGFTTILSVGGTLETGELTDEQVRRLIGIIVKANTLQAESLDVSLRDAEDESIDLKPALERLGARTSEYTDRIDYSDAESVAEGSAP